MVDNTRVASEVLAKRICDLFDVDIDLCASVTIELLPEQPIKITFARFGGEKTERIEWDKYLLGAEVVTLK